MRPPVLFPLFASVNSLKGIGAKTAGFISRLCGNRVVDLIWHLPAALVDRTYAPKLINARPNVICTLKVRVIEHIPPQTRKQPYKVRCSDGTDDVTLIFFKAYPDSIQKNLPTGAERVISGKLESFNGQWQMSHPDYIVKPEEITSVLGVEPVYPLTAGITNKMLNKLMKQALAAVPTLPEWQDEPYLKATGWPSFNQALKLAHHPVKLTDLEPSDPARSRLAYDELLANQLALAIVRERVKKQQGREINGNGLLRKKVLDALPFKLTSAQEKVLREIAADQASKFRMLRLLQGDVGSGKTIVALLTMLNAVECGTQAAIMAPTEILAKQHLETIQPLCDEIGVRAELLTGRVKGKARTQILEALAAGEIDILIGTHALFVEDVVFKDLACVIVDEQHRFGVHQRLALSNKGNKADILVMTATPIPRSLVLTAYGDMEYSKIDQVPEGRKPVDTRVMPVTKLDVVVAALQRKLTEGCRAYWVCPLVEESEKIDLAAAEERFSTLQQIFGNKVGLVHGKMKEKEKDEVMERFKSGAISLLVATTVIEVGVNVPEATVMVIEHAERFGLAQLHQLRGRIKRGFQASTCILLYSYPLSETSRQRLNTMRETEDGFEIAEKDLELRGGGEILGTRQSGFNEFRLADMNVHKNLLLTANKDARMMLELDPNLKTPRGEALRILLYLFERDDAVKTYLAG
ncbi:MAG TPA: ATP-dependent DNA helicase RecG [Candidatus Scatocola faecipullorum]|uniref:ATP-dependent DNA helicase RecG n=1 Tax=Candidatus Scatocola faecipullorum TaxID=2840917 RepID=A0A9D1SAH9_9PROT|nr:ATP-dependent DNA helicase RecG [Candidatus Scatocola faecipullorum]